MLLILQAGPAKCQTLAAKGLNKNCLVVFGYVFHIQNIHLESGVIMLKGVLQIRSRRFHNSFPIFSRFFPDFHALFSRVGWAPAPLTSPP